MTEEELKQKYQYTIIFYMSCDDILIFDKYIKNKKKRKSFFSKELREHYKAVKIKRQAMDMKTVLNYMEQNKSIDTWLKT